MAETKTRVSLKGMSDEEKKERKKMQQREYMANRRKQDPEFSAKQKELLDNIRRICGNVRNIWKRKRRITRCIMKKEKESMKK